MLCVRVTDDVVGGIKAQQYTLDGWCGIYRNRWSSIVKVRARAIMKEKERMATEGDHNTS